MCHLTGGDLLLQWQARTGGDLLLQRQARTGGDLLLQRQARSNSFVVLACLQCLHVRSIKWSAAMLKASDVMMSRSCSDYAYNASALEQYNVVHMSDGVTRYLLITMQCAGFIETRPFTGKEAMVQSNHCQLQLCIILSQLQ